MTRPQELCLREDQISQNALYKKRIESAKAQESCFLHLIFGAHNFSPFISVGGPLAGDALCDPA